MNEWHSKSLEALASAIKNYRRGEPDDLLHSIVAIHSALDTAMTGFLVEKGKSVPSSQGRFPRLVDTFVEAVRQVADLDADAVPIKDSYSPARNKAMHRYEVPDKRLVEEYLVMVPEWLSAAGIDANAIDTLYREPDTKLSVLTPEVMKSKEVMDRLKRSQLARGLQAMLGRVERAVFAGWSSISDEARQREGPDSPEIKLYGAFSEARRARFHDLPVVRGSFLNRTTTPTKADVEQAWEEGVLTLLEYFILKRMLDEEPEKVGGYLKGLIRADGSNRHKQVEEALRSVILG